MSEPTTPVRYLGPPVRGITQGDVSHAADALLRTGERPTIEKVRVKIGKGSPNTINPMLDAWWKTVAVRLDAGPAALHRLPEAVAHVAEALWMQALEESRRRARAELKTGERLNADNEQTLAVRSHVLTLREGELDSRLRERDSTIDELNLRLREITGALRKEQASRELLARQINELQAACLLKPKPKRKKLNIGRSRAKPVKRLLSRTKRSLRR